MGNELASIAPSLKPLSLIGAVRYVRCWAKDQILRSRIT